MIVPTTRTAPKIKTKTKQKIITKTKTTKFKKNCNNNTKYANTLNDKKTP